MATAHAYNLFVCSVLWATRYLVQTAATGRHSADNSLYTYDNRYGYTVSKSMDQPCNVANPARSQLNREKNEYFPVPVYAWELGLARRVRQSRPAPAWSSPYLGWIWCLLTEFLPTSAAASIYLIQPLYTPSGQSRVYRVTHLRTYGVHCRESADIGPVNVKIVPTECWLGRSPWTS